MKENMTVPWKRIIMASVASVMLIFILTFIDVILCSRFIITFSTGKLLMFAVVFVSSFIGGFFINTRGKSVLWALLSGLITFVMLYCIGIFTQHEANNSYTLYIFIILTVSSCLSCIIRSIFR